MCDFEDLIDYMSRKTTSLAQQSQPPMHFRHELRSLEPNPTQETNTKCCSDPDAMPPQTMDEDNIPFKVTWKHVDMKPAEDYKGEKTVEP